MYFFVGTPPSDEVPEGLYPTIVTQESGAEVLVVQEYTFGKYLGYLEVTFDDEGKVLLYEGNPILLNSSVPEGKYSMMANVLRSEALGLNHTTIKIGPDYLLIGLRIPMVSNSVVTNLNQIINHDSQKLICSNFIFGMNEPLRLYWWYLFWGHELNISENYLGHNTF